MTNKLILMLLLVGSSAMISAQRYNVNTSYSNSNGYTNNYGSDYYNSLYNRLSRADRRSVDKLYSTLEQRQRRAYRDGYLSDYESRRIADIERQIDSIYYRYNRGNRNSRYRQSYSYSSRNNSYRGCR